MTVTRLIPNALMASAGWDAEGPVTVAKLSTDDGATTAVYSPTSGNYMRFTVNNTIPSGAVIASVTFGASVLKLDPVDALTRNTVTINSSTYESGNFSPSTNGVYQAATWALTTNPSNGQVWTVADLTAMQIGIKKENGAGERCSFLYADVNYTGGGGGGTTGQIKTPSAAKPIKVLVNGTWTVKPLQRRNGSEWVVTSY